jgi:hypothetical protein
MEKSNTTRGSGNSQVCNPSWWWIFCIWAVEHILHFVRFEVMALRKTMFFCVVTPCRLVCIYLLAYTATQPTTTSVIVHFTFNTEEP